MADGRAVVLAVLGDGPYWSSPLEILGPPPGASFYRPFNYREAWAADDLLSEMVEGGDAVERSAVVGIRFRNDDGNGSSTRFLPLRKANVWLRRDGGLGVRFVLGDYIYLDDGRDDFHDVQIPPAVRLKDGEPVLARHAVSSEITAIASWRTGHSPDHRMWAQLGKSTLIPQSVRDKYADRVVLFCTGVSELNSDEAVPAKKVNKHKYGDVVGYRLTVGATYAISLEMRTIRQPGQSTFAPAPDFEFVNDEKQFASSTRVLPFTGNYREVGAWVRPLSRQQAPLNLWWHPRDAPQATTRQDSLGIPLRVPVVVKRHFPVGLALLTLILLLSGGFLLAKAAGEGNDAQTTVSVLIAAATVLVSTGAATLQKAMEAWTKQG